jgi:DNA-3-methyladenine glycosylase II
MRSLDVESLAEGVKSLCKTDPELRIVVERLGIPPLWSREPGFPTLVHIILEQQVSLASAKACFDKLHVILPNLEPANFLKLTDDELLRLGFSRQKSRYTRILAQAIIDGSLDMEGLNQLQDDEVFSKLTGLTGIGPWTANIYLLMALGRQDIWPAGDLALEVAIKNLYKLDKRPSREEFLDYGKRWQPHRAIAARILWHYYLSR